ncbi:MAG: DUF4430 domain-containing protein [Vallitaleaceae bacterium]|jgi:hypothetical protein|nr:DUF4430 domain-containing protein [Vallitaleaceae bacterium]
MNNKRVLVLGLFILLLLLLSACKNQVVDSTNNQDGQNIHSNDYKESVESTASMAITGETGGETVADSLGDDFDSNQGDNIASNPDDNPGGNSEDNPEGNSKDNPVDGNIADEESGELPSNASGTDTNQIATEDDHGAATTLDETNLTDSSQITISIYGPDLEGALYSETQVYVEGMRVLDALKSAHDIDGLLLDYSGSGDSAYIVGIDNIYEFDYGPLSGWLYAVNGTFPLKSSGAYGLDPGDNITFHYTLDNGIDVGAKQ